MKVKGKILTLSLLPLILVALETFFFVYMRAKGYPELVKVLLGSVARIMGITLVITFAVVIVSVEKITRSLKRTMKMLEASAQGDLTTTISPRDLKRKDEIGHIARDTEKLKNTLRDIAEELQKACDSLQESSISLEKMAQQTTEAADSVAIAVGDIASSATTQAEAAENIAGNMVTIGDIVEDSVRAVDDFEQLIYQIKELGDQGIAVLSKLEGAANQTQEEIRVINEQTRSTNEAAEQIKEAAEFIAEIASQTNLLALNASIEAARAGEQGRGFAVVAEQIKTLAEQSNSSAVQIDAIIGQLLIESGKAVETMKETTGVIATENNLITDTRVVFDRVQEGITSSETSIEVIKAGTDKLEGAKGEITDELSNLSALAEENAASTEETAASTEEMSATMHNVTEAAEKLLDIAEVLREKTSIFKLQ